jgi:predicted peptidase
MQSDPLRPSLAWKLPLLVTLISTSALAAETGQSAQTLNKQVEVKINYLLFLPAEYGKEQDTKWPIILFLHGAGERGDDVNLVKKHGPPKLVEGSGNDSPARKFIVVSPQCPPNKWWEPREVITLLDEVSQKYSVDPDRVYLTGLSMGGFGTWETSARYPERFAAIAPICGGGDPRRVRSLKDMPVWVFHGDKDPTVPVQRSIEMVDALKQAGNDAKFTRYPNAGHDSWTETYNNAELYAWFLQHKRGQKTASAK